MGTKKKKKTMLRRKLRLSLKGDLAKVKDALTAAEEAKVVAEKARHKVKFEVARLKVDRTSLLLELGRARTRCLLSNLKPTRTTRPWRRNTIRPWK